MKRGKPPERKTRLKREAKLRQQSHKAKARNRERQAVRDITKVTYGVCQLARLGGCFGQLETHELVKSSQMREAKYIPSLCTNLCAFHNQWVERNHVRARRLGVEIQRWAYDRFGEDALAEATRLRERLWTTGDVEGRDPFWETLVDL